MGIADIAMVGSELRDEEGFPDRAVLGRIVGELLDLTLGRDEGSSVGT